MSKKKESTGKFADLRKRAQALLSETRDSKAAMSPEDIKRLVHELDTYQIELELQNEDLRLAQEELQKSRQRFSDLYDFAPIGYLTISDQGLIIESNLTAADMLGMARGRLLKKAFSSFIADADQKIHYHCRQKLLATKEPQTRELRLRRKGGREFDAQKGGGEFDAQCRCVVSTDSDGEACRFRTVIINISDRKREEKEKERLEARLRQSQKMEAIGTLAGGIAHDFNNILTVILGNIELVIDDLAKNTPARNSLNAVKRAGERARDLVAQILAFSRQSDIEPRPIKPHIIIKEAIKLLRSTIPSSVEIRQDIDLQIGPIVADPTQIHQVLMNICTNAVHAMNEKGILDISLRQTDLDQQDLLQLPELLPGPYMELSVSDTGTGMSRETTARIFDPFFTTKMVGKGTGLGLSVVHGIVENHRGMITVESTLGRGTTFHVFLPVSETEKIKPVKDDDVMLTGKERILFVDDEEIITEMWVQILGRLGYRVRAETSSTRALATFRAGPDEFDIVITDQTMPNLSGDEMAREMLKIRPDIPIILCTGYSSKVSRHDIKELGIREFMMKPVDCAQMTTAIRRIMDERR